MGINFPASPTVGQKYPQPAVAGIPVYTWDGEKWTTVGGSVAAYAPPSTTLPLMDATPAVIGIETAYARGDHVHPSDTTKYNASNPDGYQTAMQVGTSVAALAVRYDVAQALSVIQQQQARQNVYAAPFDALAYSGLQINGGMEVSQERGSVATNVNGSYVCDGWKLYLAGAMVPSAAAAVSPFVPGFSSVIYSLVATAAPSLAASDQTFIANLIEGWRIARLAWGTANAQPVTISFWSGHHRTGLYSVSVRNGASNRSYVASYTQAAADVPQFNVITIPGDTTGTWTIDNTVGIALQFAMASGANATAPAANAWQGGNFIAAPGQVNGIAATSDIFRITGVVVLPGSEAPSAARSPFVMRPFPQELELCKRYFEKSYNYATLPGAVVVAGTNGILFGTAPVVGNFCMVSVPYTVEKRAAPTLTFYNGSGTTGCSFYNGSVWANTGTAADPGSSAKTKFCNFNVLGGAGVSIVGFDYTADARL